MKLNLKNVFVNRLDEDIKRVDLDYPRDMSIWRGIGYHIDAAFQWKDGTIYHLSYSILYSL